MSGNVRRRGRPQPQSWWQKNKKWVLIGSGAAGGVVVLVLLVMLILSLSTPAAAQQDAFREKLSAGSFSHELREGTGGSLTGFVWSPPKADGVVVYQEVNIVASGGKCQSVTADLFASKDGKGPTAKKQQLGSYSFKPGSAVEVKPASGAPQPLVDRGKREFEQMANSLTK